MRCCLLLAIGYWPSIAVAFAQDKGHRSNSAFAPWDNYTDVCTSPTGIYTIALIFLPCTSAHQSSHRAAAGGCRRIPCDALQEVVHPEWWPDGYQKYIDAENNACYDPKKAGASMFCFEACALPSESAC